MEHYELEIVAADDAHLPIIEEIAHQTWPDTFGGILSKEQIDYMLEQMYSQVSLRRQVYEKGNQFVLVKEGAAYLGYASYELNYQGTNLTKLHKIYILPRAQGKGVGKALIGHVVEKALEHKSPALRLNVNRGNKAIQFYQKHGFEIIAQEDIPIGNGFLMQDYVMEKKLREA